MLNKLLVMLVLIAAVFGSAEAHYMWIETTSSGSIGQEHIVKIFYGEYSYDYYEKVDSGFTPVNRFRLILVTPDKQQVNLECLPGENFYSAKFVPDKEGFYSLLLINEDIDIVDWREYELGVVKQHFYSNSNVYVGSSIGDEDRRDAVSGINKLSIYGFPVNSPKINSVQKVKVLLNKTPVPDLELSVGIPGGWIKKIYTDNNGEAEFSSPLPGLVIIEAVHTEDTPGNYNGKDYENIRNVSTFSIILTE